MDAMRVNPLVPDITPRAAASSPGRTSSRRACSTKRASASIDYKDTHDCERYRHIGNFAQQIGIPDRERGRARVPRITFADATQYRQLAAASSLAVDNTFQYTESLTYTRGRHIFKTGLEFCAIRRTGSWRPNGFFGAFDFNGLTRSRSA